MRFFFHIAYHGQFFNGWQRHPKAKSVQETIEVQLSKIFKTPIAINGCGRTDTHVHASQFFFHADLPDTWDFDLVFRLNKVLPYNISVYDLFPVDEKRHARFDAVQRKYDYLIHTSKDPFLSHLSSLYELELDVARMAQAVKLLPQYKDYRAFCTSPDKYDHTICYVHDAKLFTDASGGKIRFQISANRYLTRMIRIIMGKLLKIGTGDLSVDEFHHMLETLEIPKELDPAHPTGLYLSRVVYPFLDVPARENVLLNEGLWIQV